MQYFLACFGLFFFLFLDFSPAFGGWYGKVPDISGEISGEFKIRITKRTGQYSKATQELVFETMNIKLARLLPGDAGEASLSATTTIGEKVVNVDIEARSPNPFEGGHVDFTLNGNKVEFECGPPEIPPIDILLKWVGLNKNIKGGIECESVEGTYLASVSVSVDPYAFRYGAEDDFARIEKIKRDHEKIKNNPYRKSKYTVEEGKAKDRLVQAKRREREIREYNQRRRIYIPPKPSDEEEAPQNTGRRGRYDDSPKSDGTSLLGKIGKIGGSVLKMGRGKKNGEKDLEKPGFKSRIRKDESGYRNSERKRSNGQKSSSRNSSSRRPSEEKSESFLDWFVGFGKAVEESVNK